MNFKPQNLYISVIDLFSIFIPGAIATIVIYHNFNDVIQDILIIEDCPNYQWALVLLYAYILGHLINRIGSKFDHWLYDPWKEKRMKQSHRDIVVQLIGRENDAKYIRSTFTRAKYRIMEADSPIYQQIEKEMADAKFFRSLLVICIRLVTIFTYKLLFMESEDNNWWILLIFSFLLGVFSCWNYFKLRYKSTVTAYKYLIYMMRNDLVNTHGNVTES